MTSAPTESTTDAPAATTLTWTRRNLTTGFYFYRPADAAPGTCPAADAVHHDLLTHFLHLPAGTPAHIDPGPDHTRVTFATETGDDLPVACTTSRTTPDTHTLPTPATGDDAAAVRTVHVSRDGKHGYVLTETTGARLGRSVYYVNTERVAYAGRRVPVRQSHIPQSAVPDTMLAVLVGLHTGHHTTAWTSHTTANKRYYLNVLAGLELAVETRGTWAATDDGRRLARQTLTDPDAGRRTLAALLANCSCVATYAAATSHEDALDALERELARIERISRTRVALRARTLARRAHQIRAWASWCTDVLTASPTTGAGAVGPATVTVAGPRLGRPLTEAEHAAHLADVDRQFCAHLATMDCFAFENFIGQLLDRYGLEDVTVTRRSGDGGIDVRAHTRVADVTVVPVKVQAKRWTANVGIEDVQRHRGTLDAGDIGILYTTSGYTPAAIADAARPGAHPVTLVTGPELAAAARACELGIRHLGGHTWQISDFTEFTPQP